jgi:hypothetical protein
MQIDLIDYCANERRNVYGQVMRWIMVVKDQFTSLCYLRAIPNKNAKYVCFELKSLFGLIGYPHIFHTDNGSEFTAEQVVGMLKRWNQTILTVTARPRKSSDQGLVEIINRLVKRVMNSVLASEIQKGKVRPNWTKYLGEVNSILNRQCGQAKNDVSAYETVFGIDFDPIMPDTKDSIRRCTTIQERMDVVASSRFRAVVKSMYDLTLNPSDTNDSVSMELTLPQVGNVCDTTFSGCDFSQRFAEILEGPDVSNSVQAQSTNDYEKPVTTISAAAMMKNLREKRSSLSTSTATAVKMNICITTKVWVITCFNSYSLIVAQKTCCHLLPQATQSKS